MILTNEVLFIILIFVVIIFYMLGRSNYIVVLSEIDEKFDGRYKVLSVVINEQGHCFKMRKLNYGLFNKLVIEAGIGETLEEFEHHKQLFNERPKRWKRLVEFLRESKNS